ncbi:MAG: 23S rRNA (guanosine(2251)-2'-O)-methyltransferase RlmB [Deltaproteobacteria bacterium]|nr:23S rRNA (guanosine(2251)-2'-O)-methyltransferase RlmB [Deltaproteobacteria bacterium]
MTAIAGSEENLVCGINAVTELLRVNRARIQQLYCQEQAGRRVRELAERARREKITVKTVPAAALERLARGIRHQGVAAVVASFVYTPLPELLKRLEKRDTPVLVALDGITDARNLGAIIRTAAAAGVAGLLLPERRSAAVNAAATKTAAGALENLPVSRVVNLADALARLKEAGFWICGAATAGGENLYEVDWPERLVLVLGSEDKGLRPIIARACDFSVTIPLAEASESLNVGVAAAVTLFEINRSRRHTRNASVSRSAPSRGKGI